eukprot:s7069_g6.t1
MGGLPCTRLMQGSRQCFVHVFFLRYKGEPVASHVNASLSSPDSPLAATPTAGFCTAEKADDDVVICCAVRTPLTKAKRGAFANTSPDELLSFVFRAVVEKTKVNPKDIGELRV